MDNIKASLAKLAAQVPSLRAVLVPLLKLANERDTGDSRRREGKPENYEEAESAEPSALDKSKKKGPPPMWNEFLDARYQGGKKKIPNPNSKTRDRFPSVAVGTAMRDENTKKRTMKEYREWLKQQNPTKPVVEPLKLKEPTRPEEPLKPGEKDTGDARGRRREDQEPPKKVQEPQEEAKAPEKTPKKPRVSKPKAEKAPKANYAKAYEFEIPDNPDAGPLERIRAYAKKHLVQYSNTLTANQDKEVREYTGSQYSSINGYLRNPEKSTATNDYNQEIHKSVTELDSLFESKAGVLPEDLQLVRAANSGALQQLFEAAEKDPKSVVGATIQDHGYMSTSLKDPKNYYFGGSPYKLIIKAPKGTKGIYVGPPAGLSKYPDEMEVILDRSTKLKVTEVDIENKTFHVTVMPRKASDKTKMPKLKKPTTAPEEKTKKLKKLKKPTKEYTSKQIKELQSRDYAKSSSNSSDDLRTFLDKKLPPTNAPKNVNDFFTEGYFLSSISGIVSSGEAEAKYADALNDFDKLLTKSEVLEDIEVNTQDYGFVTKVLHSAKDGDIIEQPYLGAVPRELHYTEKKTRVRVRLPKGSKAVNLLTSDGPFSGYDVSLFMGRNARFAISTDPDGTRVATLLPD